MTLFPLNGDILHVELYQREYNGFEILYETTDDPANCSLSDDSILSGTSAIEVNGTIYCRPRWDSISCWPLTPAHHVAIISCFGQLNGVPYDTSQNASRLCLFNGSWTEKSDYSKCRALEQATEISNETTDLSDASIVYYFGYGISLIALSFALAIFFHFKDLKCIRNTIHTNLMLSYLFYAVTWIGTATLQNSPMTNNNKVLSNSLCFLYIVLTYFTATSFFWMFIEGLYLYILVVKTFSIERVNIFLFTLIGWGLPFILLVFWAPIKYLYTRHEYTGHDSENRFTCPWQDTDIIDIIVICPIYFVLLVNMVFLIVVIYVLLTNKMSTTATAQEFQQYRKAAKALLVLTPLLGIAYILLLVTPESGSARIIFTYLHATLNSTQGFTVAVLYCFLNSEVQNSLRYHLERWKNARTLKHGDYPLPIHHSFSSGAVRGRNGAKCYRLRYHASFNNSFSTSSSSRNSSQNGGTRGKHFEGKSCKLLRNQSVYIPRKPGPPFEEYL